MKRQILTGILALAAGVSGLMAQQPAAQPAPAAQAAPPAQAAAPAPAGPQVKSPEEAKAVQALLQAQAGGPDAVIKAADELLQKFADTQFREVALSFALDAYRQKRDKDSNIKAQIYADDILKINPNNLQANITLGEIISETTSDKDFDKVEQWAKAQKYFDVALNYLKTAPKPNPALADADWESAKKEIGARVHNGLGLMAMTKKDWPAAISEFTQAAADDPQQTTYEARLAAALHDGGKNDEALKLCDKILATPNLHPQIKAFVDTLKATTAKALAAPQK